MDVDLNKQLLRSVIGFSEFKKQIEKWTEELELNSNNNDDFKFYNEEAFYFLNEGRDVRYENFDGNWDNLYNSIGH